MNSSLFSCEIHVTSDYDFINKISIFSSHRSAELELERMLDALYLLRYVKVNVKKSFIT